MSFTVKCSKLIDVSGGGESFVWTEPVSSLFVQVKDRKDAEAVHPLLLCIVQGERATAMFTLSGSRALSLPLAEHKCQLGVSVVMEKDLPWLAVGTVMPVCTTALRTHHGAFKDPCTETGESTVKPV